MKLRLYAFHDLRTCYWHPILLEKVSSICGVCCIQSSSLSIVCGHLNSIALCLSSNPVDGFCHWKSNISVQSSIILSRTATRSSLGSVTSLFNERERRGFACVSRRFKSTRQPRKVKDLVKAHGYYRAIS